MKPRGSPRDEQKRHPTDDEADPNPTCHPQHFRIRSFPTLPYHKSMFERLMRWLFPSGDPVLAGKKVDPTLGERGENVAAKFLTTNGYKILQRNFMTKVGEVDIVARQGKVLVFVEVKTRQEEQVRPEDQVNAEKMHQITKASEVFLSRFGQPQPPARFDVIAILWPEGREPIIRHHENAFEATY